ncbi:MAG: nicotinamide-nucleotide amidohydrolase family protein [Deltaproteobacteria bacterium]|nr:nicotinamide-nucleotide amidohydrolase family protein [Deltaproteobacteria bacterium]
MERTKKSPEKAVGELLKKRGLTIAAAESCTGGLLSSMITDVPGSSGYFTGSVVAYDNEVKKKSLGVKSATLREYGAVSVAAADEMASGVRKKLKSDIGVAVTGIVGPGGGSVAKPVGTVFIGVSVKDSVFVKKFLFKGERKKIKKLSSTAALEMVLWALKGAGK